MIISKLTHLKTCGSSDGRICLPYPYMSHLLLLPVSLSLCTRLRPRPPSQQRRDLAFVRVCAVEEDVYERGALATVASDHLAAVGDRYRHLVPAVVGKPVRERFRDDAVFPGRVVV